MSEKYFWKKKLLKIKAVTVKDLSVSKTWRVVVVIFSFLYGLNVKKLHTLAHFNLYVVNLGLFDEKKSLENVNRSRFFENLGQHYCCTLGKNGFLIPKTL